MAPSLMMYVVTWNVLVGVLWIECVTGRGYPVFRHARFSREGMRRGQRVDETTKMVAQDIAVKLTNVSSVTQLYNLMSRYNKDYCDNTIVKELEKFSKSSPANAALLSMKSYCRKYTQKHLVRSMQRREVRSSMKLGNEAQQINDLLQKVQRSKKTECKPANTVIEFPSRAGSVYLPRCTNVKRCSGCCKNKVHVCQPVIDKIKVVQRKVVDIQVRTRDHTPKMQLKVLELEQHTKCECKCDKTVMHCSPHQEYDELNCSCQCRNAHEMKHCSNPRSWNPINCKCECQVSTSCSLGHYRDPDTCKCARSPSINNLTVPKLKRKQKRRSENPK